MNKVLNILSAVFITTGVQAQVPEKMSYQVVVHTGKNTLVANQPIGLRISIIQGAVNGANVYQEVFHPNPVTNANGLVIAEIGSGTPSLGAIASINWANGPYFIKAETDTTGGTNYTITGTTRLLSVPHALHAKTAESFSGTITETDPAFATWDKDYDDMINTPNLSVYATKDMANQNFTNLADPVNAQDAATKAYVDALLKRLEKLETEKMLAEGFFDERDGNYYKIVKIGTQGFTALPGGGFMQWTGFEFGGTGSSGFWWSASWNSINPGHYIFSLSYNQQNGSVHWIDEPNWDIKHTVLVFVA